MGLMGETVKVKHGHGRGLSTCISDALDCNQKIISVGIFEVCRTLELLDNSK